MRIWDAVTRSLLRMTRLDSPASCVDYSPDGERLIVGLGSRDHGATTASSKTSTGSSTTATGSGASNATSGAGGKRSKRGRPGSGGGSSESSIGGGAKTGGFVVLNETDFVLTFEARDAKKVCWGSANLS